MKDRVGFIGLGIMGAPMALNVAKAGYHLTVFTRTRLKAAPLEEAGATIACSPAEVADASDVVMLCVTDTPDVEAVLFAADGVLSLPHPGLVVVDCSTISPAASRAIAHRLTALEMTFLDAPVTGGQVGAVAGTLTVMVGGPANALERVRPVLSAISRKIVHCGPAGAGQTVKLCNQILGAVNQIAVSEALLLAAKAGIDLETMLEVTTSGAASSWALDVLGRKVVHGDLAPAFMVRLMQKDLHLVLELARELDAPLPGTALANQLLRAVQAEPGGGELGTQAMIRAYERLAAFPVTPSRTP
ncbi:MAG: NAD(P)-dependent oxidoreductase [Candidatus Schekmanbacteria bacterium]|nr:NAD(P)-dependent oxidoreductase [Candidatus Schekmanbacteria bacterium]